MDHSEETRRIYHEQHKRVVGDERAMQRFIGMFSEEYFGVPKGFFAGKKVLDAGCGDTAKLSIALYRMGCRDLHGFDLGTEFIPVARSALSRNGVPPDAAHYRSGSVLDVPFPDESFDVVCRHGVLIHLNDLNEVQRAFRELARVTRRGGLLYTVYGLVGGLYEDCLLPALRDYYRRNNDFREIVDRISPADFGSVIDLIERGIERHEGERVNLTSLRDALDTDLCVTIQNAIQAPVRLAVDEAMIRRMHAESGFSDPRRLKRYVRRKNLRRLFAPLHYEHEQPISRLLYGSGNLEFIASKDRLAART
jgi:SAM-dependent methyltransferase